MPSVSHEIVQRFQRARRDPSLVVLEGFHALKHALRFGAVVDAVATCDPDGLAALSAALAPDVAATLQGATIVTPGDLAAIAPRAPRTGVIALARRPAVGLAGVLALPGPAPVVLLEAPRTMGNMGACVRVAAGAGAAAVLTTGTSDPWHADAVRGAAGLHFALPVARVGGDAPMVLDAASSNLVSDAASSDSPSGNGPLPPDRGRRLLLAVDPEGDELTADSLPDRAILAFGTERHGLTDALLATADARVRIPMEPGVSSLNLATSVAVVLYAWRLAAGARVSPPPPS